MAEAFQVLRALTGYTAASSEGTARLGPLELEQIGPLPGVQVHVALCYYPEGAAIARYDTAGTVYDTAVYVPPPPCDDVSCHVKTYTSKVGRDQPLERFRAGTASVTLYDPNGRYSPWNTAAEADQWAAIRPGIELRVWVETAAGTVERFTGRVTAITDTFPGTTSHEVQFAAVDWLSLLAAYDGLEQYPEGAGETSGPRIARIATKAEYDKPRALDAGTVTLQATTLAKNALDECGLVTDTETGVLFADPRDGGTLVHRDRNGLISDPRYTTVQAVFGDVCDGTEIEYSELTLATDTDKIKNVVSIAREGGTAVTLEDGTSKTLYGPHTYRRFDLIHEDAAESAVIAQRHLDFYAYAANRVEALKVEPAANPDQLDAILPLNLLDRIELRRRADGFQVVAELQIQGISETVTPDAWTLEFATFSADAIFDAARYDIDLYDVGLYAY